MFTPLLRTARCKKCVSSFCFDDPPPAALYTLSLHDALPISTLFRSRQNLFQELDAVIHLLMEEILSRSEERFSRNAETDLVCRLLLEKKKKSDLPLCNTHCFVQHSNYLPQSTLWPASRGVAL